MRILLVRHGESHANVDQKIHRIIPDHEIALSSRGIEQAQKAGEIIKAYFEKEYGDLFDPSVSVEQKTSKALENMFKNQGLDKYDGFLKTFQGFMNLMPAEQEDVKPKIRLWHSPYRRTRETTKEIVNILGDMLLDVKEDVLLCEQHYGLFDGLNDDEQKEKFPAEFEYFQHVKQYNGKFWTSYPMGESAFNTACRLRLFFETLYRDSEQGINDVVIVCHGTVLRLFTMAWLNKSHEWFAAEKGPGNCAIRILENNVDKGYLYGGHRDGKAWEYKNNHV